MTTQGTFLPGIELGPGVWTDREQLRFGFSRSSGPGGQNVNKVNTKTELRVAVTALHGMSDRAVGRLRTMAGRKLMADGDLLFSADKGALRKRIGERAWKSCGSLLSGHWLSPKRGGRVSPARARKNGAGFKKATRREEEGARVAGLGRGYEVK